MRILCQSSIIEAVFAQCGDYVGLVVRVIGDLSTPVLVENSILSAQKVFGILQIVVLQVTNYTRSHVCVVRAGSNTRYQHGTS